MSNKTSRELYQRACNSLVAGVNSPVRTFSKVNSAPLFIKKANGAYLYSVENKKYIDLINGWLSLILGHNDLDVKNFIKKNLDNSWLFGLSTELELLLAEKIKSKMAHLEKIRFLNSGTEAAMTALRLARGYTKRSKILKFIGNYHGHLDSLLISSGTGLLTLGLNQATSAGIPDGYLTETILSKFNDCELLNNIFSKLGEQLAAVIIEPVMANAGLVLPDVNFLKLLKTLCEKYKVLLIFDEIVTGFRIAEGGAAEKYHIIPDITLLGKIIGGGFPIGAVGARAEIMDCLSPLGSVYQAGTFSGHPIAMSAGIATLDKIFNTPNFYQNLEKNTQNLVNNIKNIINKKYKIELTSIGSLFYLKFSEEVVQHSELFVRFFQLLLKQGILWPPSPFEVPSLTAAHQAKEMVSITDTIQDALLTIYNSA